MDEKEYKTVKEFFLASLFLGPGGMAMGGVILSQTIPKLLSGAGSAATLIYAGLGLFSFFSGVRMLVDAVKRYAKAKKANRE